jgi:aldose 1-epimerase
LIGALTSPLASGIERIEQGDFGKTSAGEEVKLVTLRNAKGLSAEIITYGAIIKTMNAPDRDGRLQNVLLTTDRIEDFEKFNATAAIIGRVANRIAGARFELDGTVYQLPANHRSHTIHGGLKGFDKVVWSIDQTTTSDQDSSVTLTYLSVDGEEGFPGNLKTSVTYTLTDANELRLDYHAETDKPTIVNLTNHAYWNLAGEGDCLGHVLWIPADSHTPTDDDLIPTGEIRTIDGTPLDFRKPTRIGQRIDQLKPKMSGYDHNYVLDENQEMKWAARLSEPKSGRVMEVRTTQPAVQLYTGNHVGYRGVCLETQHYPDAIHHGNFPSIVVRPGEPLKQTTVFKFNAE